MGAQGCCLSAGHLQEALHIVFPCPLLLLSAPPLARVLLPLPLGPQSPHLPGALLPRALRRFRFSSYDLRTCSNSTACGQWLFSRYYDAGGRNLSCLRLLPQNLCTCRDTPVHTNRGAWECLRVQVLRGPCLMPLGKPPHLMLRSVSAAWPG